MWRTGVGVDRHGNLMFVAAEGQTVVSIAKLLRHIGAVRAMELDINPDWHTLITYTHRRGLAPEGWSSPSPNQSADRYLGARRPWTSSPSIVVCPVRSRIRCGSGARGSVRTTLYLAADAHSVPLAHHGSVRGDHHPGGPHHLRGVRGRPQGRKDGPFSQKTIENGFNAHVALGYMIVLVDARGS